MPRLQKFSGSKYEFRKTAIEIFLNQLVSDYKLVNENLMDFLGIGIMEQILFISY